MSTFWDCHGFKCLDNHVPFVEVLGDLVGVCLIKDGSQREGEGGKQGLRGQGWGFGREREWTENPTEPVRQAWNKFSISSPSNLRKLLHIKPAVIQTLVSIPLM